MPKYPDFCLIYYVCTSQQRAVNPLPCVKTLNKNITVIMLGEMLISLTGKFNYKIYTLIQLYVSLIDLIMYICIYFTIAVK